VWVEKLTKNQEEFDDMLGEDGRFVEGVFQDSDGKVDNVTADVKNSGLWKNDDEIKQVVFEIEQKIKERMLDLKKVEIETEKK